MKSQFYSYTKILSRVSKIMLTLGLADMTIESAIEWASFWKPLRRLKVFEGYCEAIGKATCRNKGVETVSE